MQIETFRLPDGDHNIGRIYRPDTPSGSTGAMILCHGGPGGRQCRPEEIHAWDLGPSWIIVTFDNYACGETGGSDAEMTFDRWGKNTAAVYAFVQRLPGVEAQRVGLIGISSGSEAALRCAISYETPAFIVSIATCASPNYGNWPAEMLCRELEALQRGETRDCCGHQFPLAFFLDAVGRAPLYRIGEVKCPVFFLQGQADNAKRRGDAMMAYAYMMEAGRRCKHLEIPGGDHGLDNVADQRREAIQGWMREIGMA
jgi:pimeloyl-ACP methyl ester carboxylesterase